MDINGGGILRFMAEQGFNGKQVGAIFIKVCAKRMAERMAGKLMFEAKFRFFGKNKLIYGIRSHGPCGVIPVGEQEPRWSAGMEPVLCQDIQRIPGEDRIPVRTHFGIADMDAHGGAADVLVSECADFTNAKSSGIHERKDRFVLEVGKRMNKSPGFFL